jgi:hypothetical protein
LRIESKLSSNPQSAFRIPQCNDPPATAGGTDLLSDRQH